MRFEHKVTHCSFPYLSGALAQGSDEGWELVAVTRVFDGFSLFFKRPVQP